MDDSHGDSGHNGHNGQYEQNGQNGQIGHNGQIGQNGHAANVQMGATKFTIATQTSANPNSDNQNFDEFILTSYGVFLHCESYD